MPIPSHRRNSQRFPRSIFLATSIMVLLILLGTVDGSVNFPLWLQPDSTITSPPVSLQAGTAGSSTIYANNTSARVSVKPPLFDYVDNNEYDVDSSADKGTHSSFPAQQSGPDSIYDTLTEENTEGIEDYVDDVSNVDASSDVGTHSNFNNMRLKDGSYDVLSEVFSNVTYKNSAESYSGVGQSSHSFNYPLQTASGNDRLVVVTVSAEDGQIGYATSVKFNNQEMRKVASVTVGTGYSEYVGLWYFLDSDLPSAAGSYSVAATFSEAMEREIYVAVAEYVRVKQSAPDDYDIYSLNSGGSISVTLTAAAEGSVVVAGAGQGGINSWDSTNNIVNLQTQLLTSSGSALGHHTNVDSGSITVGWDSLSTRECMVGAVWQPAGNDNNLDLEVQWTSVIDFLSTEKLNIFTGALGDEDLKVDYWNGTGWENLATDLNAYSCNEYTVSLTSTTFTIRFRGGTTGGDLTQDQWQIDASLLRVEGAGSKQDAVDNDTSDVDSSADVGTLSNFNNMKTKDDSMASLTEGAVGGAPTVWWWQEDTSGYTATSSFETYQFWSSWTTNSTTSGTINKIGIYVFANPGNSPQVKLGIYDNNAGVPNNLLGQTNAATITGAGWLDLDIIGGGVSISASTTYHIAHITNIAPTTQWRYYKAATPTSRYRTPRVWPNLFSPAGTTTASASYRYGAYRVGYSQPYYQLDQEVQWTDLPYSLPNEELCVYGGTMGAENIKIDVRNGSSWVNIISDVNASAWNNVTITSFLTSSAFTVRFKGGTETSDSSQDTWLIDVALIHIWHSGGNNYELDLEVQWVSADYTQTNEQLCIYVGATGAEDIKVDAWNGSAWISILTDLTANSWNNVSVTSYLTSATFTVRFKGGTETSDTNQDSWNIDANLLHLWSNTGDFNYVLRLTENNGSNWKVRLNIYSQSNMSRLKNCSIYIYDGSNSTQIVILNGVYSQQTGPWYDLVALDIEYVWMYAEAFNVGTTHVYAYLEILVPNSSTYARYTLAFEIT